MRGKQVGVMTKYPALGQVKTRLASTVGDEAALRVYRLLLQRIHDELTGHGDVQVHAAVSPSHMVEQFTAEYPDFAGCLGQEGNDLGERMSNAVGTLLQRPGSRAAMLIGCDIPGLTIEHIEKGFAALEYHDVVLGPTTDGGYYLIGMKEMLRPLFDGPVWGQSSVLAKTLDIAAAEGYAVALLDRLADVDTWDDLKQHPDLARRAGIEIEQKKGPE